MVGNCPTFSLGPDRKAPNSAIYYLRLAYIGKIYEIQTFCSSKDPFLHFILTKVFTNARENAERSYKLVSQIIYNIAYEHTRFEDRHCDLIIDSKITEKKNV